MGHPGYDEHSFPREQTLFTMRVAGPRAVQASRLPKKLPARPSWMQDLRSLPESAVHVRRDIWMAGVPSVVGKSSPYSYAMVNGVSNPNQYVADPEFVLQKDRLEEWVIHNHPPNC